MKYIVLVYMIAIGISPIWATAANTDFKQQIRAITECNDNIDNDGDGLLDFASDPDCISWEDNNESTEIQPTLQPNPQPETKPNPESKVSPQPQPEAKPIYSPELKPVSNPQPEPLPKDYIDIITPIQYSIDNPTTNIGSNIVKQADTYEDRARLDSIFSVIMMGVLSLGLRFKDFFLKLIS